MSSKKTDTTGSIRDQVEAVRDQETAELNEMNQPPADQVDVRFVNQCYHNKERGDGVLYATLHRDKFVYNKSTEHWLVFNGNHWEIDKMHKSHAAVETVAMRYPEHALSFNPEIFELEGKLAEAELEKANLEKDEKKDPDAISDADNKIGKLKRELKWLRDNRKEYNDRAGHLRNMRRAKNCLEWSHKIDYPLAIVGEELDRQPHLLPCANGVVDLRTGKLKEGKPDDYLLKAIKVPYDPKAKCPTWDKFIKEIHRDDPDLADFIKRLLGYAIAGLTTEHFIAVFIGEGRNGKGTMFEVINDILGDLAWSIQPELILDQKNAKSSAGPSADLVSLMGRRIVVASETDENRRISASKVKQLTGGDTICARAPHDKYEINFIPSHTLFLYTNHVPQGLTKDFALLKRLLFIKYPLKFIDDPDPEDPNQRPRDPELPGKLIQEKEGILRWLVEGHLEWRKNGLNPPDAIKADVETLRRQEDDLGRYIDDMCKKVEPEVALPFSDFYKDFKEWYLETVNEKETYLPSKKKIAEQMRAKGYIKKPANETGGTLKVYGLQLPIKEGRFI